MKLVEIKPGTWINPEHVTHIIDTPYPQGMERYLSINVGPEPPIEIEYKDDAERACILRRLSPDGGITENT